MKTRSDNQLAPLKGLTWNGQPADEYLYARLMGEDGEPAWDLTKAAKEVSRKLSRRGAPVRVTESTVSKWRKREERLRKDQEQYDDLLEATRAQLAKYANSGLQLSDFVDAQILLLIAQAYAEGGAEEAVKFVRAMTELKRALTAEKVHTQGVREWEESTAKLRATIDRLTLELKSRGFDPAALDELNKQVVGEVDKMILANKPKG